jgi:hypothetical protein
MGAGQLVSRLVGTPLPPVGEQLRHLGHELLLSRRHLDRVGFPVPGDMRVQEQGASPQAACAAGADALAEAEAAHAAANPAGVR